MTAPLRERLEDLLTRLDSPADRTLVQAAIRELAEREKDAEREVALRNDLVLATLTVLKEQWLEGEPAKFGRNLDAAIATRKKQAEASIKDGVVAQAFGFQAFDCHFAGNWERCDKDCAIYGLCKRRTSDALAAIKEGK